MVHIGPDDAGRPGLLAQADRWSHGRASILFVVLAGGIVAAAVGFVVSNELITQLGLALDAEDWRQLTMNEPTTTCPCGS